MPSRFLLGLAYALPLLLNIVSGTSAQAQEIKPRRIMCIGASITMGQGVNGGYRLPLEKMFEGAGIPVQFVGRVETNSKGMDWPFHDGYPGYRIDQIEDGVIHDGKVVTAPIAEGIKTLHPDTILLLCGTNDVRQNHDLPKAPQRLDHLLDVMQAAAPGVEIYVSSIPPDLHYDDAVRQYNAGVAQAVAKRAQAGQKVYFVDNYAILNAGSDISGDRTHPNQGGYIKLAREWFNVLAPGAPQVAFAVSPEGATAITGRSYQGYQLTMKVDAQVTDLGLYCASQPLTATRTAGIFDVNGQQLAQVTLTPKDAPSGLFVYGKLATPLKLEAGKSYIFACNSIGFPSLINTDAIVDPAHFENPRFYFDHNIALISEDKDSSVLKFPGTEIRDINGGVGYFGPNFRLAP